MRVVTSLTSFLLNLDEENPTFSENGTQAVNTETLGRSFFPLTHVIRQLLPQLSMGTVPCPVIELGGGELFLLITFCFLASSSSTITKNKNFLHVLSVNRISGPN